MNSSNNNVNLSGAGGNNNNNNQANQNNRPSMIHLLDTSVSSSLLTPSPSIPNAPAPTPATPNLILPAAAPIVLQNHQVSFRVPASESSINVLVPLVSTERMHVMQLEDIDDSPPPE